MSAIDTYLPISLSRVYPRRFVSYFLDVLHIRARIDERMAGYTALAAKFQDSGAEAS